jgi:hypothetical protein
MNARVLRCKNLTGLLDIACSIKTHTTNMKTCRVELLDPWFNEFGILLPAFHKMFGTLKKKTNSKTTTTRIKQG